MPRYDDTYIKRPGEELEYTPKMVEELEKCSKDFYHFLNYVKILHPDEGRIPFVPRDYQKKLIDLILNENKVICATSRQVGKCVHEDSMITVRNKKTGKIEKVHIGDFFEKIKLK